MTEFALIVPVFMLLVVGMLVFGRMFFYWIETNHVANETARWAVVDRNPTGPRNAPAQCTRRARRRSSRTTPTCASTSRTGDSRPSNPAIPYAVRVQVPSLHQVLRLRGHDQGLVDDATRTDRGQRRSR